MGEDTEDIWATVATERLRLADELDGLTDEQWHTSSQCEGWDVDHVVAHLVQPFEWSGGKMMVSMAKSGFNFDKAMKRSAGEIAAEMTPEQLTQSLRDNAENHWTPPIPGMGAEVVLGEIVVHGQDIRRPLGLEETVPQDTIDLTLDLVKKDKVRSDYRERCGVDA